MLFCKLHCFVFAVIALRPNTVEIRLVYGEVLAFLQLPRNCAHQRLHLFLTQELRWKFIQLAADVCPTWKKVSARSPQSATYLEFGRAVT